MSVVIDGTSGITLPDGNEIDGGFTAKAWVNFNGTGTVAIRDSGNVSSLTDNSTGNYSVNFSSSLTDANYAVSGSAREDAVSNVATFSTGASATPAQTSSVARVLLLNNIITGLCDSSQVHAQVAR